MKVGIELPVAAIQGVMTEKLGDINQWTHTSAGQHIDLLLRE